MLGSRGLRRWAAGVAAVGVLAGATACDPPPEPSDHIGVTYVEEPDDPGYTFGMSALNDRGQAFANRLRGQLDPSRLYSTTYFWDDGELTRITEESAGSYDISNRGHVVGWVHTSDRGLGGPARPFLWMDGELTVLPGYEGSQTHRIYVNDRGVVATTIPGSAPTAWHEDEMVTSPVNGRVYGINNRNQVLLRQQGSEGWELVLWEIGGGTTVLDNDIGIPWQTCCIDLQMNDRGMVLGVGVTEDDHRRSVLWHDGEVTDLGTLGGNEATATAINAWGQVVGYSTDAKGNQLPFLWYQGEMNPLEGLNASGESGLRRPDINNWGQVVGLTDVDGELHPYLWQNGRSTDLGDLVEGTEPRASSINDLGQAKGTVRDSDGNTVIVIWHTSPTWGYYPDGVPTS